MTDLRTAVEAILPCTAYTNGRCLDVDGVTPSWRPCNACAVLALIPEGSVLVNGLELDELRGALEAKSFEVLALHEHPPISEELDMKRLARVVIEPYESDPTMGRCRVCGEDGSRVGYIDQPDVIAAEYRGS